MASGNTGVTQGVLAVSGRCCPSDEGAATPSALRTCLSFSAPACAVIAGSHTGLQPQCIPLQLFCIAWAQAVSRGGDRLVN